VVLISHTGENKEKIDQILSAAQKRFGVYGFEKTAMHEIASDIGISKASLYYYFPDKQRLFNAVIESEQNELFQSVENKIKTIDSPVDVLSNYILIRLDFFKSFMNLGRLRHNEMRELKSGMKELISEFNNRELEIVTQILEKGKELQVFDISDCEETAKLFIETIKGYRSQFMQNKEFMYIENDEFAILKMKMEKLTQILIKGITKYN
jgi:AcrR family transcriptional regulator